MHAVYMQPISVRSPFLLPRPAFLFSNPSPCFCCQGPCFCLPSKQPAPISRRDACTPAAARQLSPHTPRFPSPPSPLAHALKIVCFAVSVHALLLSPDNHQLLFLFRQKSINCPFSFAPFDLLLSPSSVSVSLNPHYIFPDNYLYLKSQLLFKYKKMSPPHNVFSPPDPLPTACCYHNHTH